MSLQNINLLRNEKGQVDIHRPFTLGADTTGWRHNEEHPFLEKIQGSV